MPDFVINLFAKIFGIDPAIINGWKTYAGGLIEVLTGAGGVLVGAGNVVLELSKLAKPAEYLNWGQQAFQGHDPAVIAIGIAAGVFGMGLKDIGLAHKHDKLMDAIANQPAPEPAAQPQNPTHDA